MAHTLTYDDEKEKTSLNSNEDDYEHGKHPNSLKNLTPYPKGVSGNLGGRRPNYTKLKEELSRLGDEITTDYYDEPQGTRRQQVLQRIWKDAIGGDMKKIQLLAWLGCLEADN
jgi:hypothetical protein